MPLLLTDDLLTVRSGLFAYQALSKVSRILP